MLAIRVRLLQDSNVKCVGLILLSPLTLLPVAVYPGVIIANNDCPRSDVGVFFPREEEKLGIYDLVFRMADLRRDSFPWTTHFRGAPRRFI